jgi:hypothetical protein
LVNTFVFQEAILKDTVELNKAQALKKECQKNIDEGLAIQRVQVRRDYIESASRFYCKFSEIVLNNHNIISVSSFYTKKQYLNDVTKLVDNIIDYVKRIVDLKVQGKYLERYEGEWNEGYEDFVVIPLKQYYFGSWVAAPTTFAMKDMNKDRIKEISKKFTSMVQLLNVLVYNVEYTVEIVNLAFRANIFAITSSQFTKGLMELSELSTEEGWKNFVNRERKPTSWFEFVCGSRGSISRFYERQVNYYKNTMDLYFKANKIENKRYDNFMECIEQDEKGIFDFSLYLFGIGLKKKTLEQKWFEITVTDNNDEEDFLLKKKE